MVGLTAFPCFLDFRDFLLCFLPLSAFLAALSPLAQGFPLDFLWLFLFLAFLAFLCFFLPLREWDFFLLFRLWGVVAFDFRAARAFRRFFRLAALCFLDCPLWLLCPFFPFRLGLTIETLVSIPPEVLPNSHVVVAVGGYKSSVGKISEEAIVRICTHDAYSPPHELVSQYPKKWAKETRDKNGQHETAMLKHSRENDYCRWLVGVDSSMYALQGRDVSVRYACTGVRCEISTIVSRA